MQTDKVTDHIVNWLLSYIRKSGLKGFVIGISGGIDSSVTSTLCAKTNKYIIALNMPIYQAEDQVSLSLEHIAWLEKNFDNVKGVNIELTPAFDQIEKSFPDSIRDGLTMANTSSRLRMLTLYAFASGNKMLVAGTGNKVEDFGIGFYTKYGDGGVDISPIGDLTKSEVYMIGKRLGITENILTAPPTDGLWKDNRTDETQIGATYPELEWAMKHQNSLKDDSGLDKRQKKVLSIYKKLNKANKHKMEPIPVCIIPDEFRK